MIWLTQCIFSSSFILCSIYLIYLLCCIMCCNLHAKISVFFSFLFSLKKYQNSTKQFLSHCTGFYYFIFTNDNEITNNFVAASFDMRKTVFDVTSRSQVISDIIIGLVFITDIQLLIIDTSLNLTCRNAIRLSAEYLSLLWARSTLFLRWKNSRKTIAVFSGFFQVPQQENAECEYEAEGVTNYYQCNTVVRSEFSEKKSIIFIWRWQRSQYVNLEDPSTWLFFCSFHFSSYCLHTYSCYCTASVLFWQTQNSSLPFQKTNRWYLNTLFRRREKVTKRMMRKKLGPEI